MTDSVTFLVELLYLDCKNISLTRGDPHRSRKHVYHYGHMTLPSVHVIPCAGVLQSWLRSEPCHVFPIQCASRGHS